MHTFKSLTVAEQLAEHIRKRIMTGELSGDMPGIRRLSNTLGVSSNTVMAAVGQLEHEGFLLPQGQGRRSRIARPEGTPKPRFRVTFLPYERADMQLDYVLEIRQRLREEGYEVRIADKSLVDLGMMKRRIERLVKETETHAWVVFSAPREVLEWFATHRVPTFAVFGRFRRLPLAAAGLDKIPAFRAAVRRLIELGHRRIVLLQPKSNREPVLAQLVREALEEMELHGIETGPYNVPAWQQTPAGLRACLDSLFAVTPPTALIFDRPNELIGAQIHLAHKGILAPRDISLVCDDDPAFEWCEPSVSCIRWQSRLWARRVLGWVKNVANDKEDIRQSFVKADFIEKSSVGPVSGGK